MTKSTGFAGIGGNLSITTRLGGSGASLAGSWTLISAAGTGLHGGCSLTTCGIIKLHINIKNINSKN